MAAVASRPPTTAAEGDYDAFLKLVSAHNPGPYEDLKSFHQYVLAQPHGVEDLKTLETSAASREKELGGSPVVALGNYSNQTSANGSVINLWVYQRVYIYALGKQCTINMGGVTPGFPGGATFGTLYYDNANDMNGDCDVYFTGFVTYYALYFRRNGNTFATYQSGNVGAATGAAGGTGNWHPA